MRNKLIFMMLMFAMAITMASCSNAKEKEEHAFSAVVTSTSQAELQAYLNEWQNKDGVPVEHIEKIKSLLSEISEDSLAYAKIIATKDITKKVNLEEDYLTNFPKGRYLDQVNNLMKVDNKKLEEFQEKESEKAFYNAYKDEFKDYNYQNFSSAWGVEYYKRIVFDVPDENGKGKFVKYDESKELGYSFVEFGDYEIAPGGEIRVLFGDRYYQIRLQDNGIYFKDIWYEHVYSPERFKVGIELIKKGSKK